MRFFYLFIVVYVFAHIYTSSYTLIDIFKLALETNVIQTLTFK